MTAAEEENFRKCPNYSAPEVIQSQPLVMCLTCRQARIDIPTLAGLLERNAEDRLWATGDRPKAKPRRL